MNSAIVSMLALAAAAVVPGLAFAGSPLSQHAGGALPEAADRTLGISMSAAIIYGAGTVDPDYSTSSVSVEKQGVGLYYINFGRSLRGCAPVAAPVLGTVVVNLVGISDNDGAWIFQTSDTSGNPENASFSVINFCSR